MYVTEVLFLLFPTIIGISISFFVGIALGLCLALGGIAIGIYSFYSIPGLDALFVRIFREDTSRHQK